MRVVLVAVCGMVFAAMSGSAAAAEKPPKITYDPYTKTELINGDGHLHNALFDLDKPTYWFAATIADGVPGNPILMYDMDSPDWFFFENAADIEGNQFRVVQGNRDVSLGSVEETVGVVMSPSYLQSHRTTGMNIKLIGSRGEKVVQISPETVAVFDDAYEREIAKFGGTAAIASPAAQQVTPSSVLEGLQGATAATAKTAVEHGGLGIAFLSTPAGLVLMAVAPGSIAATSGLKVGQVIESANGVDLRGMPQAATLAVIKAMPKQIAFKVTGVGVINVVRP